MFTLVFIHQYRPSRLSCPDTALALQATGFFGDASAQHGFFPAGLRIEANKKARDCFEMVHLGFAWIYFWVAVSVLRGQTNTILSLFSVFVCACGAQLVETGGFSPFLNESAFLAYSLHYVLRSLKKVCGLFWSMLKQFQSPQLSTAIAGMLRPENSGNKHSGS